MLQTRDINFLMETTEITQTPVGRKVKRPMQGQIMSLERKRLPRYADGSSAARRNI